MHLTSTHAMGNRMPQEWRTFAHMLQLNGHTHPQMKAHEESAKLATNDCGTTSQVRLTLEKTSWNSRKLFASVNVAAPEEQ
eukprot:scaffold206044_cov19-Tisochrysis_lutea.AAC.1